MCVGESNTHLCSEYLVRQVNLKVNQQVNQQVNLNVNRQVNQQVTHSTKDCVSM